MQFLWEYNRMQLEQTLEEKLALIAEAIKNANGDPKKEAEMLNIIADPQDNLNCEGCQ